MPSKKKRSLLHDSLMWDKSRAVSRGADLVIRRPQAEANLRPRPKPVSGPLPTRGNFSTKPHSTLITERLCVWVWWLPR